VLTADPGMPCAYQKVGRDAVADGGLNGGRGVEES
jgi:hypothetical protein